MMKFQIVDVINRRVVADNLTFEMALLATDSEPIDRYRIEPMLSNNIAEGGDSKCHIL